jgi:basic membrane lipoprotein Med (substrate-binding protein (PBP1-ABC) superfamily)
MTLTTARRLPTTVVALLAALALAVAAALLTGAGLAATDSAGASWNKKSDRAGASWNKTTHAGASWNKVVRVSHGASWN